MEIEAKFTIPDEQVFQRLLEIPALSGFDLGPAALSGLQDTYLDTAERAILAGGYACRLRRDADRFFLTLKGLGRTDNGIHRRAEHEVELAGPLPLAAWPQSEARDLAVRLSGGRPLHTLFTLDQTRHDRPVTHAGRSIARLSLDQVRVYVADSPDPLATYMELEAELLPDGSEDDLLAIATGLRQVWKLQPVNRSKFERALALVDGEAPAGSASPPPPAPRRLSGVERAALERLAGGTERYARRARLLLAWDDGLQRADLLAVSRLSPRRARYWLNAFRARQMGIFPLRLLSQAEEEPVSDMPEAAEAPDAGALPSPVEPAQPLPDREPGPSPAAFAAPEPARPAIELLKAPGLEPDEAMSEAGRKTLRFHFRRMLYHEPGTRLGQDPESLHDMRVATRRMRAALRIFMPYYDPDVALPLEKGLRQTGRTLGAVRDLDVFREKIELYLDTLPEPQRASLDPLLEVLLARREAAREQMIRFLDGKRYARFQNRLAEFVETEGLGSLTLDFDGAEPRPTLVCHVVPVILYERLAAVRAFDAWVSVPNPPVTRLHALRITAKRLRYSLEFFREVLGPGAKAVIAQVVALQDHLGALQDAVVASGILRDFLVWGTWGEAIDRKHLPDLSAPVIAPGVAAYLSVKQAELQQLLATFPALWQQFKSPDFSGQVADAVSVL